METVKKIIFYKLAIFKGVIGTLKAGIAAYIAGVAANTWTQMTTDAHILIMLSMFLSMITYLDGYVDQTASKLAKGKLPIGDDFDTQHYVKGSNETKISTNPS